MPFTLTVAGFDVAPHLRVAPGEGFDPFDQDMLEYAMSESSGVEGPELLSETAGAREWNIPVHLTPDKDANYPDTKQGMHNMLRDINGLLAKAKGKSVVWQDDGADAASTYTIIAARYEADYNYRRAQRKWGSGVIRLWTKPYGTSGAYREIGTAIATGLGAAIPIGAGSVAGDTPAHVRAGVQIGSFSAVNYIRAAGVAVVPSGYNWDIPVASFIAGTGTTTTDPYTPGTTAMFIPGGFDESTDYYITPPIARIGLSPATMYEGRHRILAVAAGFDGNGVGIRARSNDQWLGDTAFPSCGMQLGHNILDLGVLDVLPQPGQATVTLDLHNGRVFKGTSVDRWPGSDYGTLSDRTKITRLLVLPDEAFAIMVDSNHALYGIDNGPETGTSEGTLLEDLDVDALGNQWSYRAGLGVTWKFARTISGGWQLGSVAAGLTHNRGQWISASAQDLHIRANVTFFTGNRASNAFQIMHGENLVARVHQSNGSRSVFALMYMSNTIAFSTLASVTMDTPNGGFNIMLTKVGKRIWAELWEDPESRLASIGVASLGLVAAGGYGFGMSDGDTNKAVQMQNIWAMTVASTLNAPRDRIVFDSEQQSVIQLSSASAYIRNLTHNLRGRIPTLQPSTPQRLIGFQLPMTWGQRSNDRVDTAAEILERWRYAR